MGERYRRIIILVLDGVGLGELPDAAAFGDEGSDSLGNVIKARGALDLPHLARRGLGMLKPLPGFEAAHVTGAYGRMAMRAAGKDSTAGHWEMAGVILEHDFPLFPNGFPPPAVAAIEQAAGRKVIGNRAASGTAIIDELGAQHLVTGDYILYTSADSVCQLAAHVDVVPREELYAAGRRIRKALQGPYAVARVIVRPFEGNPGSFRRLDGDRRDYSLPPPAPTVFDTLRAHGRVVRGIGKVEDIFAGCGFDSCRRARDNDAVVDAVKNELKNEFEGVLLANLNDTDTAWGHRNDVEGYARALERFDARLPEIEGRLAPRDVLFIVSDHGNDPTTASTDHSREYALLLVWGPSIHKAVPLGTRATLADIGQTAADNFGLPPLIHGTSFRHELAI